MTNDTYILNAVCGYKLEFNTTPVQVRVPNTIRFSQEHQLAIDHEIQILLTKGAIQTCAHVSGEFISNIFTRPKKSGELRVILNLKELNKFVSYNHFKMVHLDMVLDMVWQDDFMASIDLEDAYFSVQIHNEYTKFLRFFWRNQLYQFLVLPFGYSGAPRLFTKITNPIMAKLHSLGVRTAIYIDDIIIVEDDKLRLQRNVDLVIGMLTQLGFKVNFKKSTIVPTQNIQHLGFILSSTQLQLSLPREKCDKIEELCAHALDADHISIRDVTKLIGVLTAAYKATMWGKLFYRDLEREKIKALRKSAGKFDTSMSITESGKANIRWWLSTEKLKPFYWGKYSPAFCIQSDASQLGWGCTIKATSFKAGGRWAVEEKAQHINILELKASFFGLQTFCSNYDNIAIHMELDNSVAVAYINNKGGMIESLDQLAKDIWLWARDKSISITASHIPGKTNTVADNKSRIFHDDTEWSLNSSRFYNMCTIFGTPSIDLFASRLNYKCDKFCSWQPCPQAMAIDAFSLDWGQFNLCYAFPPFCLLGRVLSKLRRDKAEMILIAPAWSSQYWYPLLNRCIVKNTQVVSMGNRQDLLVLPYDNTKVHKLWHRLNLSCYRVSGKH